MAKSHDARRRAYTRAVLDGAANGGFVSQAAIVLACAGAVAALLYAEHRQQEGLKRLAKPAASAAFVALAVASGAMESQYGRLILAGLTFCLIGDVFLMAKTNRAFLAGMFSFATGHLAYIGAFASIWAGVSFLLGDAAIAITAALAVMLSWLWPHLGSFRAPVAVYSLIVGAMAAISFATASPEGGAPYWPAVAGAVMFAVSDIAVARDRFVSQAFINRLWGLPLYYAAQLLLAASASRESAVRLLS